MWGFFFPFQELRRCNAVPWHTVVKKMPFADYKP